jgi:hypothetical protein
MSIRRCWYTACCAALSLLLGIPPAASQEPAVPGEQRLHVRLRGAPLRAEPRLGSELLDSLAYGTELRQIAARGNWYEIEDLATNNRGWVHRDDAGQDSPLLEPGYGPLRWGQSREQVAALTGAEAEGQRLVQSFESGPIERIAYNFRDGSLWFVEVRYRPETSAEELYRRARDRFGRPHGEGDHRLQASDEAPSADRPVRAEYQRWEAGPSGFALVTYTPLDVDGLRHVRAERWSLEAAAEMAPAKGAIPALDF